MELESQETLISLLLITVLAAAVPLVAARLQRFRIPLVVGEIVVGIIIGKSGFNLITENPILQFLAWFGFIFLMFLSGLELDFGLLRASGDKDAPFWKKPVPQALGVFCTYSGSGHGSRRRVSPGRDCQ
jgi:Kef-type K+ transport system membrane component KefB